MCRENISYIQLYIRVFSICQLFLINQNNIFNMLLIVHIIWFVLRPSYHSRDRKKKTRRKQNTNGIGQTLDNSPCNEPEIFLLFRNLT